MPRTLYLVLTGAPAPEGVVELVQALQGHDWQVTVLSTPTGADFHGPARLEEVTGDPVRVRFRRPGQGTPLPLADAVLACTLTFDSTNKFAQGLADNFANALLCEMAGYGVSTAVVPHCKPQLASPGVHPLPGHLGLHGRGHRPARPRRPLRGPSAVLAASHRHREQPLRRHAVGPATRGQNDYRPPVVHGVGVASVDDALECLVFGQGDSAGLDRFDHRMPSIGWNLLSRSTLSGVTDPVNLSG